MKFELPEHRKPIPKAEASWQQIKLSVAFTIMLAGVAESAIEGGAKMYDRVAENIQERLVAQKFNREIQVWTDSNGKHLMMAAKGSGNDAEDLKDIHRFLKRVKLINDPNITIVFNGQRNQWIISVATESKETIQKLRKAAMELKQQFGSESQF